MKRIAVALIVFAALLFPAHAKAGIYNDIRSAVVVSLQRVSDWWGARSVDGEPEEAPPEETQPAETATPGMCQVAQQPPVIVCEEGSGFLCVNTPEAGVSESSIIIKGSIDRGNSVPASISVGVQHDYTKKTAHVDTTAFDTADCWSSSLTARPFCIDEKGFYAARIPLDEPGPYTIAVGATRLSGSAATQTVRTSRVTALVMDDAGVTFTPDVRTNPTVGEMYVTVNASLLGDCQHCDLIGASTFGVTVTVENVMKDSSGQTSRISCATNVEQGGQGKFVVGVPVGPGSNELTVKACNAATSGSCPTVGPVRFNGSGGVEGMEILSPPPQPSYSSSEYTTIPFKFKLTGAGSDTCVSVTFNREAAAELCPAADGTYSIELYPNAGINVATVDNDEKGVHIPWAFGYGNIDSPFGFGVKDGLHSKYAFQLAIPASTFTDIVGPMVGNVLSSDGLSDFIKDLIGSSDDEDSSAGETASVAIPMCGASGSLGDLKINEISEVKIGKARMEGISFAKDSLKASINADDVVVRFDLVKEGKDPIPLKLSFLKAVIDVELKVADGALLLSSPHTDCDFKSERHCKGTPAALIPQNLVGSATPFGGFVVCDTNGKDVSDEIDGVCEALNSLNAQTGLINAAVLDAVNSMLYCGGSSALTSLSRDGVTGKKIDIGYGGVLGPVTLPFGFKLTDGLAIDGEGLVVTAGITAGSKEQFEKMPEGLKIASVGVVFDKLGKLFSSAKTGEDDLGIAIAADAVNRVLFALTAPEKGIFDMDVSEVFFSKAGFDFVVKCDAFLQNPHEGEDAPSPLCNIRPRVSELLGTPLTRYGYLEPKQPLMIRLRGNRALPPHVSVVDESEIPIVSRGTGNEGTSVEEIGSNLLDVQIGGIVMSFYALEVDKNVPPDEYGNFAVKLDAQGNPLIRSMRPEEPDPAKGQIASFELTLLLAVEIGDPMTDPDDPSHFTVMVRPLADRSRLVISPVAGSNSTTIPPVALISALREKLQYAINIYSSKEDAIRIPVPKTFSFNDHRDSELVKLMGLKEITFGPEGISISAADDLDMIRAGLSASVTQLFYRGGDKIEETLPH